MQTIVTIIIITSILISVLYFFTLCFVIYGWFKTPILNEKRLTNHPKISVIIAARNEAKNIQSCLKSIANQTYPKEHFEIIVIDDNSTDETLLVINEFAKVQNNITVIELKQKNSEGKKQAINEAIKIANGELIVTTDADCMVQNEWLSTIVNHYSLTNSKMIVGPVMFQNEKNSFEKMQTIEFIALISSTAGSLFYNKAIMCNGANLTYTKDVFEKVGGFEAIDKTASGDDVLLMYKIQNQFPCSISFLKDKKAIVFTHAQNTLHSFIQQRIRWASKPYSKLNSSTKALAANVYFFNLWILILGALSLCFYINKNDFHPFIGEICLIIFGIKCFIDFLLLFLASCFFSKQKHLFYFLPMQLIYPIYVSVIGILGIRKKYTWKDRTFNGKT